MPKLSCDYGFICDVGGKGKGNEDSALLNIFDLTIAPGSPHSKAIAHKAILALVCDGVSGSAKGEEGSTFTIRHLSEKIMNYLLLENLNLADFQSKLEEFIQTTNSELLVNFQEMIEKENRSPKTTLVGLLIIGQWVWVFNIGDSRAFLVKDDQINQISVDHIGATATHEITQAIGEPSITPAIRAYNWAFLDNAATIKSFNNGYYALICSDGLTDTVNSDEISQVLTDNSEDLSMQQKVEKLYNMTINRNIEDNVSIIAINLGEYLSQLSPIQILKLSFD
jgi:protein phosphatase